jgi:hypothetical protein
MDVRIRINCDNAAFEDENCGSEIARILERLAEAICCWELSELKRIDGKPLIDINGNTVGRVEVSE